MPLINPPNSNLIVDVLNQRDSSHKLKLIVDRIDLQKEKVLRQQGVHIEVRGKLFGYEKKTVLH